MIKAADHGVDAMPVLHLTEGVDGISRFTSQPQQETPVNLPLFFDAMPAPDVPFPEDVVTTHAVASDAGLVAFFRFHKDMDLPPHAHGPQLGTVIAGEIVFTISGEARTYRPGDSHDIPAGVEHSARIRAGTIAVDVFAEADRYPLKAR